jgi:hypothetical protein
MGGFGSSFEDSSVLACGRSATGATFEEPVAAE